MTHIDLVNMPVGIVIAIVTMLLIAGMTKGLIGVGMPIVAVPLLNLVVDLPVTVAILSIPLVLSNVPQASTAIELGRFCGDSRRSCTGWWSASSSAFICWPLFGSICSSRSLIMVVFLMFFSPHFVVPAKYENHLGPVAGLVGGILGGLAALPGPLVFVYMLALGVSKDRFVQYSSMFLVVAATLMTLILGSMGATGWHDALVSTCAVIPILVGMRIGTRMRTLVSPPLFRKLILGVVMVSGVHLVAGSVASIPSATHDLLGGHLGLLLGRPILSRSTRIAMPSL